MRSSGKVATGLLVLALIVGSKVGCRAYDSRRLRQASYSRYAAQGSWEEVKAAVDATHDECFEMTYRLGGKGQRASFDVVGYARLMDSHVLPRLRAASRRVDQERAALLARALETPVSPAEPPPSAAPPTLPPAPPHALQIRSLEVRPYSPQELGSLRGRGFHVLATVLDEGGDVTETQPPQGFLEVTCGPRVVLSRASAVPQVTRRSVQESLVDVSLFLPDGTERGGRCSLGLTLTDAAGNRSLPVAAALPPA